MAWLDEVERRYHLSPPARRLAHVIANKWGAMNARYAVFCDSWVKRELGDQVGMIALSELRNRGLLVKLQYGGNPPSYALRLGPSIGE
jgi:hypothetical protein